MYTLRRPTEPLSTQHLSDLILQKKINCDLKQDRPLIQWSFMKTRVVETQIRNDLFIR